MNNVAKGKSWRRRSSSGGVAANQRYPPGLPACSWHGDIVPEYFGVMGAFGAALLVRQMMMASGKPSRLRVGGFVKKT